MRKNQLLSIGEISKSTGVSIKSLRYYERIKVLKPAFIDPDSGYRYYSFAQIYLVEVIRSCIELDIPLKKLTEFFDANDAFDLRKFLFHGKKIVEQKLQRFQKILKLTNEIEEKIALAEKYKVGEIYPCEIPEKYFYVRPCGESFKAMEKYQASELFLDLLHDEDDYYSSPDYGFLYEYADGKPMCYIFLELLNPKLKAAAANVKVTPGGTYFCMQSKISQIESAHQIFRDYLKGKDSFIAIETEIYASKYEISKPLNELRVLALPL
ncbi:MAG: MerR family transcriptional regulator [Spirochaetes bacterium]|nr:MerR family transcriptional regulator [Spirochaetota bacterium]